jgi:hypothetical protein
VTLEAIATVALNTSVDPFARVEFYYDPTPNGAPSGTWILAGTATAVLTQTPANRFWTYTFVWDPGAAVPVGTVNVVAIGVDSNGDAVFSGVPQTVLTVQ